MKPKISSIMKEEDKNYLNDNFNKNTDPYGIYIKNSSIITELCNLKGFDELTSLLLILAKNNSLSFFNNEYINGIICLKEAKKLYELFIVLETHFNNKKNMDEKLLISLLLLFPFESQKKLIYLILKNKINLTSFFYCEFIDMLVKYDQVYSAMFFFFIFDYNYVESQMVNMPLFIEKLIKYNLLESFYTNYNQKYLLNQKVYNIEDGKEVKDQSHISIGYDCESIYSQNKGSVLNVTWNINNKTNIKEVDINDGKTNYLDDNDSIDNDIESLIDTFDFCKEIQASLVHDSTTALQGEENYNAKHNKYKDEFIFDDYDMSDDNDDDEDGINNTEDDSDDEDFYKNTKLEQYICNSLLDEMSKRV